MPRLLPLLLTSALVPALPALAQDDPVVLDPVVIYATGLPTEIMRNPASITVIQGDDLPAAPVSIATLMRDVPGVQITEEGMERVGIRGETGRRVAILIDGQKLTDHTMYGQPVMVDPTTVERVEIVRGSSSVASGSRAIGGVINIITKTGTDRPFALTTQAGWFSASGGYRASASAAGTVQAGTGELDYRLSYGRMDQGDRKTPDGRLANSDMQDRNLSGHLGYRMGDHYFGLKAQQFDLSGNVWTGIPDFDISLPHRDLRKVSAFYEGTNLTPWLERLTFDIYRQTIDRTFLNDVTVSRGPGVVVNVNSTSEDRQETKGANLRAEMRFTDNSRTLAGLEYEDDSLVTDKTTVTTAFGRPTTDLRHDSARIRTFSAFAQHEIDLTDQLTATFGTRWYDVKADHRASVANGVANPVTSNSDSLALASAGLVWMPDDGLALRANISQGYTYPTLGQLFLSTTAGGVIQNGNPDLKPERATSFELGARLDRGPWQVDATLFHTRSQDYIALIYSGTIGTYQNVEKARTWGLELAAEYDSDIWGLRPHAALTLMDRQLHFANGYSTGDSGTPALAGTIGLRKDWQHQQFSGSFDLFLRGESAVTMRDNSGTETDGAAGYATLNLRSSVELAPGTTLLAEFSNLTNRSYTPYGQMPGAERAVNLFLTKSF
ncbi:MAG: TonB-dependent receptor [Paracoccus sp. (in: a-proteobacteria)]|uniref:TonB-dependent receptor n=1 Tax=Paracoccus sp. TaxID=267 RepID=UPI0026DEF0C1|nr:TonB-dependent receptor [Paracoccus sp. (in: a-proteobacteria)]MDO5622346.1 TonB-dependent receptor [Paracoccus sp. (in: a-proteobacteria)]